MKMMFWSEHKCAASVQLSPAQEKMLPIYNSPPHICPSEHANDKWEDLGPFTHACRKAADWQPTQETSVFYSPRFKVYRKIFSVTVHTQRTVQLVPLSTSSYTFLSETDAAAIPALQEVPQTLWAQGKHDAGPIKNAESVLITHKSDFRPCQQQYLLKPEAVEGITPVF